MDKIQKFLQKLTAKQRQLLLELIGDIKILNLKTHDIKPLKGYEGVFRLRKGNVRILFAKKQKEGIILNIGFRKDIYEK